MYSLYANPKQAVAKRFSLPPNSFRIITTCMRIGVTQTHLPTHHHPNAVSQCTIGGQTITTIEDLKALYEVQVVAEVRGAGACWARGK